MAANSQNGELLIGFVGDVLIDREDPYEAMSEVSALLREPDVLFGNLESPYSDAPPTVLSVQLAVLVPPFRNLDAYARAGFDVMSLANNHIVDAGHTALLKIKDHLANQGVATCGAGENLPAARRPAILTRGHTKIGFLSYASVFPHGYEAASNVPGLAPLKAHNHFYDVPAYFAPGYVPRVETIPDPKDHRNLAEDIDALRGQVHIVVTSFHWGDHQRPYVLTDHEKRTARLCIDRGADLVLGHHHHTLRGIEWYRDRPIFYGLGHFVFDHRLVETEELKAFVGEADPNSYGVFPRDGWPLLPLHPEARMTMLGWVRAHSGRITEVGFVPCRLRPDGRVNAVSPDSTEGAEVIQYLNHCIQSQKLNGKIVSEGAPEIAGHTSLRVVPLHQ